MRARALVAAAAIAALTACTAGQPDERGQQPSSATNGASNPAMPTQAGTAAPPGSTAGTASTAGTSPRAVGTPTAPAVTQPLVLAVHATRMVVDVPTKAARALADRAARGKRLTIRWADLKQPGGGRAEVRLATTETAARALLKDVRADDDLLALVPAEVVDERVRVLTIGNRHPLRDPVRYPLRTTAAHGQPEVTIVTMVGDVMLGRRVARASGDDPIRPLRPTAKRLAAAEITVGNLESTLSDDGSPTQGGDSFHADPVVIKGLKLAGFDAVVLANNHLGDYGQRALRQTLATLRDADLPYVGAGRDLTEARRPVIITRDGVRVGFIATESIGETPAATVNRGGTNRLNMPPRTGPLNERQLDRISGDIEKLADRVDVVIVIPHWGTQYTHAPEASQRRAARAFVAAGADLVIGGHPHWVQGWEQMSGSLIVHSLGNFVFDMDFQTKTMEGIFVEIVLWGGEVKAVEPVPYRLDARFVPKVVKGERAERILSDVWSTSRGPFARP